MNLEIVPYERIDPIRFGMARSEIRAIIPEEARSFRKVPDATTLTDAFREHGIHVYYDTNDQCVAVEAMKNEPTLHGRPLLQCIFEEIVEWLQDRDPHLRLDGDGAVSYGLGIALYVEGGVGQNRRNSVGAVLVFADRFYKAHSSHR